MMHLVNLLELQNKGGIMKLRIFGFIFALFFTFAFCVQSVFATVYSNADVYDKIDKLNTIYNADFNSFINKSELIGYRLIGYEMAVTNYKNNVRMNIENLNNTLIQIQKIRNSVEISDTDKNIQIAKMYQDATNLMFSFDNVTSSFLISLNQYMPSITYGKFLKKYQSFYNELNITNADLLVK